MAKFLKALILIIIFLVGVALIVLPLVYQMQDRTTAASEMMTAFRPIVNNDHATLLEGDVAALGKLAPALQPLLPALAQAQGKTEAQVTQEMTAMLGRLASDTATIRAQVGNFEKADKLPIKWTPWLFIGLGAAIVVLLALRMLLWLPARKEKKAEPAKPAAPTT
jgi:hypothetical protein